MLGRRLKSLKSIQNNFAHRALLSERTYRLDLAPPCHGLTK
jgi:hypothetical protein